MTSQFKHENVIKLAGVLGAQPELRLTTNGNAVAALIIYTNYILRNADGTTRQESERHRVIVWGLHAEKAARLLRKGSKVRVQGRMTYPTWKDKQTALWRGDRCPDAGLPGRYGCGRRAGRTAGRRSPRARAGRDSGPRDGAGPGQTEAQPQQESANCRGVGQNRALDEAHRFVLRASMILGNPAAHPARRIQAMEPGAVFVPKHESSRI